jgi:succinyl-diaminopimelate desuccinylase
MPMSVTHDPVVSSIVELIARLVRIPSRGGIDANLPVLECIEQWFDAHADDVPRRRIVSAQGAPLGLYAEVTGSATGVRAATAATTAALPATPAAAPAAPYYVLNATLDTAGFGDPQNWTHPPLSAHIADGWLYGRGAADSKAGVALFAHLLAALSQRRHELAGRLAVLFDLDEHTGRFGGARAFFDSADNHGLPSATSRAPRPTGVLIGYPGCERVMVGARGFLRARLVVHGIAAHSGGSSARGLNAAVRGAALAEALSELALPELDRATFNRPAQLTVTGIQAGDGGFTAVPDRCELQVDIRLTPHFDAAHAQRLIEGAVRAHDVGYTRTPANNLLTQIEWIDGWPAYRVPDSHPMVSVLCAAARDERGAEPAREVAGPSNIGNYLASLGVPALCGFGPRGEGIHAADERIELASIAPVYRIYERTLLQLLRG